MNFLTAVYTDIGIKKKTNQDSVLLQQAQTDVGNVLLTVLCDGMGGLAKGEVASAHMISMFDKWFKREFPPLLYGGLDPDCLRISWEKLVKETDLNIKRYTCESHVDMGTTCVAFLAFRDIYYIMNIGDSRAYLLTDNIYQLTKDHTYVQREIDGGRMTHEQSLSDPQRSVLLQCIGAGDSIEPDFYFGSVCENQCFLLCCDGFRHVISPTEMFETMKPDAVSDAADMKMRLAYLTDLNKQRMETDNITAVLIRTF